MPFDDQPLEAVFEFIGMQQQLSEFQNFAEQMEYRPCGYEGRVAVENSSKIIDGEPKNRQKRPFFAIFEPFLAFSGPFLPFFCIFSFLRPLRALKRSRRARPSKEIMQAGWEFWRAELPRRRVRTVSQSSPLQGDLAGWMGILEGGAPVTPQIYCPIKSKFRISLHVMVMNPK